VVHYSSNDLLNWQFQKVPLPAPGPKQWYRKRFWAPEIHQFDGKYYATFNARNPDHGFDDQRQGHQLDGF